MRIKLTEEQYALINEYINGDKEINEDLIKDIISKGFKETENEDESYSEEFGGGADKYIITFEHYDDDKSKRLVLLTGVKKADSFSEKALTEKEALRDVLNRLKIVKGAGKSKNLKDDTLLSNVSIDLRISDRIKKLVSSFPGDWGSGKGIGGLKRKLEFLNSPLKHSGKSLTGKLNALYILSYLKKLRDDDKFESTSSGFFFESFIAGLLGVQRADIKGEAKGAADIVADDNSTWSLKFYSDGNNQIQVKSPKRQTIENITDGIILGVKTSNGVDIIFYDTKYIKKPNFKVLGSDKKDKNKGVYRTSTKGKLTDKWVIDQLYVRENGERFILNYSDVKEQLDDAETSIMCIVDAMEKQMKELKDNIDDMITGSGSAISKGKKAKDNAETLDGQMSGAITCGDGSDKEGLIDKSVDIITKSAEVQSN